MIGVSLSYDELVYTENESIKPENLLPKLRERGVKCIELRTVSEDALSKEVLGVANLLWDHGFYVTVHAECRSFESAAADVFVPLSQMLANLRQKDLVITLHPVIGDNAAMLTMLSNHIIEHRLPVRIALENNRKMPNGSDGDCLSFVLDTVLRVDRKNVGICFDMGHYAWYAENFTGSPNTLPSAAFFSRVIHTHIHAYTEGTTHFPLNEWREPFSLYIERLRIGYDGIYNLELEPGRYAHRWDGAESYLFSVDTLRNHYRL